MKENIKIKVIYAGVSYLFFFFCYHLKRFLNILLWNFIATDSYDPFVHCL